MRTTIRLWENFYAKLGQVYPVWPVKNRIIKKTMTPSRYKEHAMMIAKRLNVGDSILEIGCGYGGLAQEILKEIQVSYTVVENKIMLIQAKKFLGDTIEYVDAKKIKTLQDRKFTLFISNHCLSETPLEYREYILKNIIKNCQKISIIDISNGHNPTRRMLRGGYEIVPLNIEKRLEEYFTVKKTKTRKNQFIYIGQRWK